MKIFCIGDSLALPGHLNNYEDTWYYLLKTHFANIDFNSFFKRALTTEVLISEGGGDLIDNFPFGADCLEFYMPSVVIIQLGIVDCAPRYLKKKSISFKILENLPSQIKRLSYFLLKKIRNRSVKYADVTPIDFSKNLSDYLNRCKSSGVKKALVIKICTPDSRITSKSPELLTAIKHYNGIIETLGKEFNFVKTIDPLNADYHKEEIFQDGYHPNNTGNFLVFKSLKNELEELINNV